MILFWHLLGRFLRSFFFILCSLITLLLATKISILREFFLLQPEVKDMTLFLSYQIASIFPIAIPLAGVLATIFLLNCLQERKEWSCLRGIGLSLPAIFLPLLFLALTLCFFSFIANEVASKAKERRGALFMSALEHAPLQAVFLRPFPKMEVWWKETWQGKDLVIGKQKNQYFFLESMPFNKGAACCYCNVLIHEKSAQFPNIKLHSYENISLLTEGLKSFRKPRRVEPSSSSIKELWLSYPKKPSQIHEIFRRVSLSLAPFTLIFLSFSCLLEEKKSAVKRLCALTTLTFLFFLLYSCGKTRQESPFEAAVFFYGNHLLLLAFSCKNAYVYRRGSS